MALAASIYVGTIAEATVMSISFQIVSTACLVLQICVYDGINITHCGNPRLLSEGLYGECVPFAYPDPTILADEQRRDVTKNGIISMANRFVVFLFLETSAYRPLRYT